MAKLNFTKEQIENADEYWNKKIVCEKCGVETLIDKKGESNLCPDCKRNNFIELIEKQVYATTKRRKR